MLARSHLNITAGKHVLSWQGRVEAWGAVALEAGCN